MNLKNINIGELIKNKVNESDISVIRICKFFKCTEHYIDQVYHSKSIDTESLLKWSKLLEYDFFRLYSGHLIIYAPFDNKILKEKRDTSSLPQFKKHVYTHEIIVFIVEQIRSGAKTRKQIVEEYGIPKTTLSRWLMKYADQ